MKTEILCVEPEMVYKEPEILCPELDMLCVKAGFCVEAEFQCGGCHWGPL